MPISLTVLIVFALGLALGALFGWLASRPALVRLQADLENDRRLHAERLKTFQDAGGSLRDTFLALSNEALQSNNRAFLDLAETRLRQARSEAVTDIDARRKAIEDLLSPMAKTLEQVDREVKDAERRRLQEGAQLLQQVASLDAVGRELKGETQRLVNALKRPSVRGRWGELQLRRVVEIAGMVEHCHFTEQQTIAGDDGRVLRPDVIVTLPGGKHVVIDAKAPLDAYLRALEAPDEDQRRGLIAEHARQVRTHLMQLSSKSYAAQMPSTPEFVVMFLPGEMFFSAALEEDPTLIEFGVERHVIPASPTTLIALLRAVAYGWQQDAMEENARRISELGRTLYESVRKLGENFGILGARLKSVLEAYNAAAGSLEGNVLVKARKFKDLQAVNGNGDIEAVEVIDRVPRVLQARELTDGLPFADATPELGPHQDQNAETEHV
jgi:DNA recombination protein RmuC